MEEARQGHRDRRFGAARDAVTRPAGWLGVGLALFAGLPVLFAAEAVPVMVRTAPGRFEIAAVDSGRAHAIAAQAEGAWQWLAAPLELPVEFSSPIFVRVVTAAPEPFSVTAETGGIVSVRVDESATPLQIRRAIAQGLLLRLAVARHGINERLNVPRWMEEACVGWWQVRADAARLDALKQASERLAPPALAALLDWRYGGPSDPALAAGAVWLLTALQTESGRDREWPGLLTGLLRGDNADSAVAAAFPGRFANREERELWWQMGWHQAVRARVLPAQSAADSRATIGALARFVFAAGAEESDVVLPLAAVVARAAEPIVASELARRSADLSRVITTLHPFYRNAGLSLAEALAARDAKPAKRDAACAAFEQDWRDAVELEAATTAALDRLEQR